MRYWFSPSDKLWVNLVPVGIFGWLLFIAMLLAFNIGTFMAVTFLEPEAFPAWMRNVRLGLALIAGSTALFIYGLIFKTERKPHD